MQDLLENTASGPDLRPRLRVDLRHRRLAHWSPRYAWSRAAALVSRARHPRWPDLTPDAVALLSQLLRPTDRGAEWGSGNSTAWFAERTAHLHSFETSDDYSRVVREALARRGLSNVAYECIPFEHEGSESAMHDSPWMRRASLLPDASLDYALVDSAPRGCLCRALVHKLRPAGLLILDNANWYIPPPATVRPVPSSVRVALGSAESSAPDHQCWPSFLAASQEWKPVWTSNGVQMTLILIKTDA